MRAVCAGESKSVLLWLQDKQMLASPPDLQSCLMSAAFSGNLEAFQYCVSLGGHAAPDICSHAAGNRCVRSSALLQWLVESGFLELNARLCIGAAMFGHLANLRYLREVARCPWNVKDMVTATVAVSQSHDNEAVLEYILSQSDTNLHPSDLGQLMRRTAGQDYPPQIRIQLERYAAAQRRQY
jgi:hypothetical protein